MAEIPAGIQCADIVKFKHLLSVYSDENGVPLKQPEAVACSEKSFFVVADTGNGRLLRYTLSENNPEPNAVEITVPELVYPIRIRLNSKNEILVLDGRQRRFVRLTPEGQFIDYLVPSGFSSASSYVPRSFSIDKNDAIYILDIFSQRVLVLNPGGKYRKHIDFPEEYGFFSDLTVDAKGNILLVDSINAKVFTASGNFSRFSPLSENLKQYMRFPTSLTTDQRGRIYLVDRNGSNVVILGQDGSFIGRLSAMGWKEGFLNYPSQLCLNDQGEIFIADTNNNRIQIFTIVE
jgi:sugar lactone lactonase YvrE